MEEPLSPQKETHDFFSRGFFIYWNSSSLFGLKDVEINKKSASPFSGDVGFYVCTGFFIWDHFLIIPLSPQKAPKTLCLWGFVFFGIQFRGDL